LDNDSFRLALAIVAIVLAGIDEVRARGAALTPWGVIAIGVALATMWWPED
jgi:hypothetical protein